MVERIGHEPVQKPGASKQDYGTPWALIRAVEARWGKLTIDLAATSENAKADVFIGPDGDSFTKNWAELIGDGIGWLNPPFADIAPWAAKCKAESRHASIIMLTPASIGAEWFHDYVEGVAGVVGLRPRITFEGCHNLHTKGPLAGQRKCDPSCLGCAPYPKDCCLTVWGTLPCEVFSTWRWK